MSESKPSSSPSISPASHRADSQSHSSRTPALSPGAQASADLHSFYDLPPDPQTEPSPVSVQSASAPVNTSPTVDVPPLPHAASESTTGIEQSLAASSLSSSNEPQRDVERIMAKFAEWHTDLALNPTRTLIKEGKLARQATFKSVERLVYLFNDCFLITDVVAKGENAGKLIQKQLIDLRSVLVEDPSDKDTKKNKQSNSFSLLTPQRDFVFIASSPEVKNEWMKAIREASTQHKLTNAGSIVDSGAVEGKVFGLVSQQGDDARLLAATLHSATAAGKDDVLLHLLSERGEDPNQKNPEGTTALHLAIEHENAFAVSLLIAHGADLSITDKDGNTPLHLACQHCDFGTCMVLISKGADVTVLDGEGKSPLWVLCEHMSDAHIHGIDDDSHDGHAHSRSHSDDGSDSDYRLKACVDMVTFLIDAGADVNDSWHGESLFTTMCQAGAWEAVAALLTNHVSLHTLIDDDARTPLHLTAVIDTGSDSLKASSQLRIIKMLLANGINPNARDLTNNTPLHLTKSLAVAGCLLVNGARPELKNEHNAKATHWFDAKQRFANESQWIHAQESLRDAREGWVARGDTALESSGEMADLADAAKVNENIHSCSLCVLPFSPLSRRKQACERCGTACCSECSSKNFTNAADNKKHRCCDSCYNLMCDRAVTEAKARREQRRKDQEKARSKAQQMIARKKSDTEDRSAEAARKADYDAREARIAEIEARTKNKTAAFEERKAKDRANEIAATMGANRSLLEERGNKLNEMSDKSAQLADSSQNFADMAKKLKEREKAKSSWFGF